MADKGATRAGGQRSSSFIETTGFHVWLETLDHELKAKVLGGCHRVAREGPNLGRPRVDSIRGSRVHNMKEIRFPSGIRVLFAFDPSRRPVMLLGGDKTGQWERWYRRQIPLAEREYDQHLRSIGKGEQCLSRGITRKVAGRSL